MEIRGSTSFKDVSLRALRSELESFKNKPFFTEADEERINEIEALLRERGYLQAEQHRRVEDSPQFASFGYGATRDSSSPTGTRPMTRDEYYGRGQSSTAYRNRTPDTQEAIFARVIRTADPIAMAELRASNDTSMNIGTAADGGDLVPTAHFNDIIGRMRPQALHERLGVRMFQGTGTTMNVPVDNEADSGAFVATDEEGAFDRDAPAMSKVALTYV